jgi:hypothetical protein
MPECPSAASTIGLSMRRLLLAMNCIGSLTLARANWANLYSRGKPAVPRQLAQLLESHEGTRSTVTLSGITERETPLPFGNRGPRCHSSLRAGITLLCSGRQLSREKWLPDIELRAKSQQVRAVS